MSEQNNGGENQNDNKNQSVDVEKLTPEQIAEIEQSEEFLLGFKDEDFQDADKVAELQKHLDRAKTTVHQKRHFREKVATLTQDLEKAKGGNGSQPPKPKPGEEAQAVADTKAGVDPIVALTFRQDHPELSKEVANEVIKHAGAYGITPEEALAAPIIKSYVEKQTNKEDVEDASIGESRNKGSGTEKRDWSGASESDVEAQRRRIMGMGQ